MVFSLNTMLILLLDPIAIRSLCMRSSLFRSLQKAAEMARQAQTMTTVPGSCYQNKHVQNSLNPVSCVSKATCNPNMRGHQNCEVPRHRTRLNPTVQGPDQDPPKHSEEPLNPTPTTRHCHKPQTKIPGMADPAPKTQLPKPNPKPKHLQHTP